MTSAVSPLVPEASGLRRLAPGLGLAGACAGLGGLAAHAVPALANYQMILAIALGVLINNLGLNPPATAPGLAFALRPVLRLSIVFIGLQITVQQAAGVGLRGLAVAACCLAATLAFTHVAGRLLGVRAGLALLVGVGTAICGASAVLAAKAATRGEDEDAAYAVACVTLFGTIAVFAYPALAHAIGLSGRAYGLWAGASIHEVAQAVAAAFQGGPEALQAGTVAKLARVALMAPAVIGLGAFYGRRAGGGGARPPFPWFLVGFLAMAGLASLVAAAPQEGPQAGSLLARAADLLHAQFGWLRQASTFGLAAAMAAMGLQVKLSHILAQGARPLLLGALASLFIATLGLALVLAGG